MKRLSLAILPLLLLLCGAAGKGAGHQADYTMTMSMDGDQLSMMLGGLAGSGALPPEAQKAMGSGQAAVPDMDNAEIMRGKVFWDAGHSRVDMYYNPDSMPGSPSTGSAKGKSASARPEGPIESFIIYTESGTAYRLLHSEKRAVMYDNINSRGGLNGDGGGIPNLQPDRMINNYEGMVDALRDTEGMTVEELAPGRVNGFAVRGVAFVMDMQEILKGMDGTNGMPDLSALRELGSAEGGSTEGMGDLGGLLQGVLSMLGNVEGKIWYSDDLAIVMRMKMQIMGISTAMELNSVMDWTDPGDTFAVPDGYEMVTETDYMKEQQQKIEQMMNPGESNRNKPARIKKQPKSSGA